MLTAPVLSLSLQYSITVTASDGKYEATQKVRIDVMNVNDVAPVFDRPGYELGLREGYISPDPIIKVRRREGYISPDPIIKVRRDGYISPDPVIKMRRRDGYISPDPIIRMRRRAGYI